MKIPKSGRFECGPLRPQYELKDGLGPLLHSSHHRDSHGGGIDPALLESRVNEFDLASARPSAIQSPGNCLIPFRTC